VLNPKDWIKNLPEFVDGGECYPNLYGVLEWKQVDGLIQEEDDK